MPYDYIEEYQKQNDETIWLFRDKDAQEKIDTSSTETDYANPLSLETMQAQLAENTKIKIDPIQDLHGYDKPWVGGVGKNLLPMTVDGIKSANTSGTWSGNVYTHSSGITITILTDSDNNVIGIKANGTSTSNFTFVIAPKTAYFTNNYKGMKLTGSTGGSSSTYNIMCSYSNNGSTWATEAYQSDAEYVISSNYDYIRFGILFRNSITVSNLIFYPMIRLSTETDSSFAPYSNICPISGHDQIDILGCGKNLVNETLGEYGYFNADGSIHTSSAWKYQYIKIIGGQSYTISSIPTAIPDVYLCWFDNAKDFISNSGSYQNGTISAPANAKYLGFCINQNTGIGKNIQLELSSSATDYEPYTESNNLSIDLPSTVYGGVLDLESGELVVDRKYKKDLSDLNWVIDATGQSPFFTILASYLNFLPNVDKRNELICNCYKIQTPSVTGYDDAIIGFTSNGNYLRIRDTRYSDVTTFKASLTDCEICYPIATPITLQLTPHQLSLLKAKNTITTSQYTQIKVTYRNGVFATLEPVSEDNDGLMSRLDKVKLDSIEYKFGVEDGIPYIEEL